ncbi:hypothetical protein GGR09_000687 [Bartonella heixiaziensis]
MNKVRECATQWCSVLHEGHNPIKEGRETKA